MADAGAPPEPAAATDADAEPAEPAYTARGLNLSDALAADAGDEALRRYKQSLLGDAVLLGADAETRRVVIRSVSLVVDGRPPIVLPLATPDEQAASSAARLVVKEGATYVLRLTFTVHREVVLGLRWSHVVTRLGVPVDRDSVVLGAYAPRVAPPYEFELPATEWPSGMLARGSYRCGAWYRAAHAGGWAHCEQRPSSSPTLRTPYTAPRDCVSTAAA